jgi:hypothetical protein
MDRVSQGNMSINSDGIEAFLINYYTNVSLIFY